MSRRQTKVKSYLEESDSDSQSKSKGKSKVQHKEADAEAEAESASDDGDEGPSSPSPSSSVSGSDSPPRKKGKKSSTPQKQQRPKSAAIAAGDNKQGKAKVKRPTTTTPAKCAAPTNSCSGKTASVGISSSSSSVAVSTSIGGDITQGPAVTTDLAAKKLVMQYMKQQNRPYSLLQVYDNLHHRIPKPNLERVFASLSVPGGGIKCKEYGKAKIYFIDQSTLTSDYSSEQLEELILSNQELKRFVDEKTAEDKEFKNQLNRLRGEPTDEDLDKLLIEAEERLIAKKERVSELTAGGSNVHDPKSLEKAIKEFNFYRQGWMDRRTQCIEGVDMLCEAMGKKRNELMSELCIETDQDVGATLPSSIKLPIRK